MALPPLAKPQEVPLSDEEIAAAQLKRDTAAARVIESHVDIYLAAQKLAPGDKAEVSIGERGKVSEGVRAKLEQIYRDAGWPAVWTTDEVPDTLHELVDGNLVELDAARVRSTARGWVYKAEDGTEYAIAEPRWKLTTKPDPRGIVLHLEPARDPS